MTAITLEDAADAMGGAHARALIGGDAVLLPTSTLRRVGRALLRQEELEDDRRDRFGNWEPGSARAPGWAHASADRLVLSGGEAPVRSRPLWPTGAPFAVCVSHDVDGVTEKNHGVRFVRRIMRAFRGPAPRWFAGMTAAGSLVRVVQRAGRLDRLGCYERWIEACDRVGAKATWFFLPGRYDRPHPYDMDYSYEDAVTFQGRRMTVAEMIRGIAASGAEIGLHGSYLSSVDATMLAEQRAQLEAVVGTPVTSIRQHYLRYDVRRTPGAQRAAGLRTDSTVGFNEMSGFRAGTAHPYHAWDYAAGHVSAVLEVPMLLMDGHFRSLGLEGDAIRGHCMRLIEEVEAVGGCFTMNWHPNHLLDRRLFSTFEWIIAECAQRGAWFATVGEVAEHWSERSGPPRGSLP